MPSSGDKITAPSYNAIRNTFISHFTTGSGSIGYGQTATSAAVAQGQKVRQVDWANLATDLTKMANHQGTAITLPTINVNGKISAGAANTLQTAANTVVAPGVYYNLPAGQYSDELLVPIDQSQRTANWNATVRHFFTVSFGDANQARYFFNAGGTIRITPSFSKYVADSINNDWENLINTLGTVVFNYTGTSATGAAPGTGSSIGFYDLTSGAQQIYTKGASTYTANDYTINAYCNVANNASGGATVIYFECYFRDDKIQSGFGFGSGPVYDEQVQGTLTNQVRMFRPAGGNVSVNAPSGSSYVRLDAGQV